MQLQWAVEGVSVLPPLLRSTGGGWRTGVRPGLWSRLEEGVGAGGLVEVFPDGVVVHGRSQRHEHVPDGVSEGDEAVALEEEHAEAVDEATTGQFLKPLGVALNKKHGKIKEKC